MVLSVPHPSSGSSEGRELRAARIPSGEAMVGRSESSSDRLEMTEVAKGRRRENSSEEAALVFIEGKEGRRWWFVGTRRKHQASGEGRLRGRARSRPVTPSSDGEFAAVTEH